jgi:GGDEF domain-containing protein
VLFLDGSFGIAIAPEHGEDVDILLQPADVAMYLAKDDARNGYEMYGPERDASAPARLAMA